MSFFKLIFWCFFGSVMIFVSGLHADMIMTGYGITKKNGTGSEFADFELARKAAKVYAYQKLKYLKGCKLEVTEDGIEITADGPVNIPYKIDYKKVTPVMAECRMELYEDLRPSGDIKDLSFDVLYEGSFDPESRDDMTSYHQYVLESVLKKIKSHVISWWQFGKKTANFSYLYLDYDLGKKEVKCHVEYQLK